jgi:CheY-like chemotaxis protein
MGMNQQPTIVTFFLICSEPKAWTVVMAEDAEPLVIDMLQGYPNHWSATAFLKPGDYRCRLYSGDDRNVTYFGPANVKGSAEDGMDALISVKAQKNKGADFPQPIQILLVEDNLATLAAYAKILRADGYVVHTADGYQSALDVAKKERINLAVCDINLWDGDGCDLLHELQKLRPLQGIAVTGYTLPEETDHYHEAGFETVLQKPLDHLRLAPAIARLGQSIPQS